MGEESFCRHSLGPAMERNNLEEDDDMRRMEEGRQ